MNYHDYHLRSYTVSDFGRTLTLDLVYDDCDKPQLESRIEFSGVVVHQFTHDLPAIIIEIDPVSLSWLLLEKDAPMSQWMSTCCYVNPYRGDTPEGYVQYLKDSGYQAWEIGSAIGFHGFVIGKNVRQLPVSASV